MGRKVNPFGFRLGVIEGWKSRWFQKKKYSSFLKEDYALREFVTEKFRKLGLEKVEIERAANQITVFIFTSRPGLIIGKGGGGIEALKKELEKKHRTISADGKVKTEIRLQVEEVSKPESHAHLVAEQIAEQLEKRILFRRLLKQSMEKILQNKEVKGGKIRVSGRLDGGEIARTEWLGKGRMPLATLRAHIDYGTANAYCTYGVVGVKVWIYKGEIFEKDKKTEDKK
ncbi:30S ribosomal protein S3 [Candidatus Azambacteria bacterium]|nr:30S ribosomal protein S3 [Candidatus Azambacteria bacterium]MBI3684894.1 30S ribosomal protein S3 [Candidatus Azambacteria bacterium]